MESKIVQSYLQLDFFRLVAHLAVAHARYPIPFRSFCVVCGLSLPLAEKLWRRNRHSCNYNRTIRDKMISVHAARHVLLDMGLQRLHEQLERACAERWKTESVQLAERITGRAQLEGRNDTKSYNAVADALSRVPSPSAQVRAAYMRCRRVQREPKSAHWCRLALKLREHIHRTANPVWEHPPVSLTRVKMVGGTAAFFEVKCGTYAEYAKALVALGVEMWTLVIKHRKRRNNRKKKRHAVKAANAANAESIVGGTLKTTQEQKKVAAYPKHGFAFVDLSDSASSLPHSAGAQGQRQRRKA